MSESDLTFINDSPLEEDDPLSFYRRNRTSPTLRPFCESQREIDEDTHTDTSEGETASLYSFSVR